MMKDGEGKYWLGTGTFCTTKKILDDESVHKMIDVAYDNGIEWIDTAEAYGNGETEKKIGKVLKSNRKIKIATKYSPSRGDKKSIIEGIEGSLKRLNVERIDLYQIHWPPQRKELRKTLEILCQAKREGKIERIGLCNFSPSMLSEARKYLRGDLYSHQLEYSLNNREYEKIYLIEDNISKIKTLAYSTVKFIANISEQKRIKLKAEADKYNISIHGLASKWCLTKEYTNVIIGTTNKNNLIEILKAREIEFEQDTREVLEDMFSECWKLISVKDVEIQKNQENAFYLEINEAKLNRGGFEPGPSELAEEYKSEKYCKPILVVQEKDGYKLVGGLVRYWAWRIAYGDDSMIRCIVIQ